MVGKTFGPSKTCPIDALGASFVAGQAFMVQYK
jgi:hypothetical protein